MHLIKVYRRWEPCCVNGRVPTLRPSVTIPARYKAWDDAVTCGADDDVVHTFGNAENLISMIEGSHRLGRDFHWNNGRGLRGLAACGPDWPVYR